MTDDTLPSRFFLRRPRDRRFWLGALVASALVLVGAAALAFRLSRTAVTLELGGESWDFYTSADTVEELLIAEGISLEAEDAVQPPPDTRLEEGMTVRVDKARTVYLDVDGEARSVRTLATAPDAILREQGVTLEPYDVVLVDGTAYSADQLAAAKWDAPPLTLAVQRSAEVVVQDGAEERMIITTAPTVAQALDALGLALYVGDLITPSPETPVSDGLVVRIERSFPATLAADGRQYSTRVRGATVGDALAAIGVAPTGSDYTDPPLDSAPAPDMTIRLVRVTTELLSEEVTVPPATQYWPDPRLPAGSRRVMVEGIAGRALRITVVRYEDGQPAARSLLDERLLQAPAPRLVAIGTGPAR